MFHGAVDRGALRTADPTAGADAFDGADEPEIAGNSGRTRARGRSSRERVRPRDGESAC